MSLAEHIARIEMRLIHICLSAAEGDMYAAAELYGVTVEQMYAAARKYNFEIDSYRERPGEYRKRNLSGAFRSEYLRNELLKIVYDRLNDCRWNRTHAAASLGVSYNTMKTYVKELKELGYDIPPNPLDRRVKSCEK